MEKIDELKEKIKDLLNESSEEEENQEQNEEQPDDATSASEDETTELPESRDPEEISDNSPKKDLKRRFCRIAIPALVVVGITIVVACWGSGCQKEEEYYMADSEVLTQEPESYPVLFKKKLNGNEVNVINPVTKKILVQDVSWVHYESDKDSIILFAKNGKRGFCNIITDEVIVKPTTYTKAWIFSEGLAAVEKNGMIGFINAKGKVAIGFRFPYRGNSLSEFVFHDGHCIVAGPSNKLGVIDKNGHWVIQPCYDAIDLSKDYAIVYTKGDFKKQIDYNGQVLQDKIIDYINELYYDISYTDLTSGGPATGRARNTDFYEYRVGRYAGLITSQGKIVTPPIYTSIEGVSATLFTATLKDGWSKIFIDKNGKVLSGK